MSRDIFVILNEMIHKDFIIAHNAENKLVILEQIKSLYHGVLNKKQNKSFSLQVLEIN